MARISASAAAAAPRRVAQRLVGARVEQHRRTLPGPARERAFAVSAVTERAFARWVIRIVMHGAPEVLRTLAERFDATAFDAPAGRARLRLRVTGERDWDAIVEHGLMRLAPANGERPDARLAADAATWRRIAGRRARRHGGVQPRAAEDPRRPAPRRRLPGRDQRHDRPGAPRARPRAHRARRDRAAAGGRRRGRAAAARPRRHQGLLPPHRRRARRLLPRHGDRPARLRRLRDAARRRLRRRRSSPARRSRRSTRSRSTARTWSATAWAAASRSSSASSIPERTGRLALLAPSLAWLRERRWAPLLRAVRPELGLLQPAPRMIVDRIARAMVPGGREGWSAVGVDEFLRGYLTPRGRAAFYAAARNIYLEDPDTLLEPPARAAGRGAVRLGPAGPDRADRLRPPRARRAPGRGAPRARLRPRAPARGAARDARRRARVPRAARPRSADGERDDPEQDRGRRGEAHARPSPPRARSCRAACRARMLSSRAGATALTGARASANRIST